MLGGMGPEATVLFARRVLEAVPARDDADHVPLLIDQNPQVPSRIARILEGAADDPAPVLRTMARRLEAAGAEALAMPCNTAHHFAPAIRAAVDVPLLSMVELSARRGATLARGGRLGLLGSPSLERAGVFDAPLEAAGLTAVRPPDPEAALATIRRIKAEGAGADDAEALSGMARAMAEAGAEAVCLCCTEFSLVAREVRAPVPVFDALDLLVDATVRFARAPAARDGAPDEGEG